MMQWHWVEVVEPPQLKSLAITVHPPAYTGLPPRRPSGIWTCWPARRSNSRHSDRAAQRAPASCKMASRPSTRTIYADDAEQRQSRAFHIDPENWIATKSGPYSLELSDADGLAGIVGQWNLRVEPDSPPSVSWQSPSEDLYVTPNAVVPIELVVKDNLAIERVDLTYERSDWSEAERERLAANGATSNCIAARKNRTPLRP